MDETGFAHASFTNDRRYLTVTFAGELPGIVELRELAFSADERRQSPGHARLKACSRWPSADEFEDEFIPGVAGSKRNRPDLDTTFGQSPRRTTEQ